MVFFGLRRYHHGTPAKVKPVTLLLLGFGVVVMLRRKPNYCG